MKRLRFEIKTGRLLSNNCHGPNGFWEKRMECISFTIELNGETQRQQLKHLLLTPFFQGCFTPSFSPPLPPPCPKWCGVVVVSPYQLLSLLSHSCSSVGFSHVLKSLRKNWQHGLSTGAVPSGHVHVLPQGPPWAAVWIFALL